MAEKATIRFATSPSSWGVLEKNGGPSGTTWMDFLARGNLKRQLRGKQVFTTTVRSFSWAR